MKQKFLPALSFLLFTCFSLQAQIEKKDLLLGGNFGIGNYSNNSSVTSSSNAGINPRIGYAIGKNQVVGLLGSFSYGRTKSVPDGSKTTSWSYGASLFYRKYMPIQNKLGWYAEANGGITKTEYDYENWGMGSDNSQFSYSVAAIPGVYFQAMPRLLFSANVGGISFMRTRSTNSNGDTNGRTSFFNLNFLSTFNFGIDFILNKKA